MKKLTLLIFLSLFLTNYKAQETNETPMDTLTRSVSSLLDKFSKLERLKITGYLQPQYQYIDSAGAQSFAGGDFINGTSPYYSRFMMRRGRFKFTYEYQNVLFMLNTDVTEKGYNMRETYVKISDPWKNIFSVTFGLLQDQFGFEVTQSSSERETPERARVNQILFPTERDLGVFGSMVLPKSSPFYGLKVDLAVMNGAAGVVPEFDSNKDFSGRIKYTRTTKNEKIQFGIGASGYYGGYRIGSVKDYVLSTNASGDKSYVTSSDTAFYNRLAMRKYYGVDFQLSVDWPIGITTIRAEYILGEQPGTDKVNRSPGVLPTAATYKRNFDAAYFYFIQDIGQSKFQVVFKYDWFDPNTDLAGTEIGKKGTNTKSGDIRFDTFGFGTTYRINSNVKIVLYYDKVQNETTSLTGYTYDMKDNVFTCRVQYKF